LRGGLSVSGNIAYEKYPLYNSYIVWYAIFEERSEAMALAQVNFRMDENLKRNMERVCTDMGMSMTTAFTIFATKVAREKRIPFEVSADPFYSESNMKHLEKILSDIDSGKAKLVEHDLIEVD
jgi:DNA-damage-inducible protein J